MVVTDNISEEKKNSNKLTEREIELINKLISDLLANGFLRTTTTADEYEIAGTIEESAIKKTRIKEENDFVKEYNRFQTIVFVYANLYVIFTKNTIPYVDDYAKFKQHLRLIFDDPNDPSIKGIIYSENTVLQSYQKVWSEIYEALENNTVIYTREELEDHIKNLKIANNQILHNFILLLKAVEE